MPKPIKLTSKIASAKLSRPKTTPVTTQKKAPRSTSSKAGSKLLLGAKWQDISILNNAQLPEGRDILNGLVSVEVCDPSEFLSLSSLVQQNEDDDVNESNTEEITTPAPEIETPSPIPAKITKQQKQQQKKVLLSSIPSMPQEDEPIAPHMHPLSKYIGVTIADIEESFDTDLSSEAYYSSPNAPIYFYHPEYIAWLPFDIHPFLLLSIIREKFLKPFPIQQEAIIPAIRDLKDVIGVAQTGSGKTLAFVLPILQNMILQRQDRGEIDGLWSSRHLPSQAIKNTTNQINYYQDALTAIILVPSRELALQINAEILRFGALAEIKPTLVVGGVFLEKQLRLLRNNPGIIIATPGRLWEVMSSMDSPIDLTFLRFFVLDEADRLVANGQYKELDQLLERLVMSNNLRQQGKSLDSTPITNDKVYLSQLLAPKDRPLVTHQVFIQPENDDNTSFLPSKVLSNENVSKLNKDHLSRNKLIAVAASDDEEDLDEDELDDELDEDDEGFEEAIDEEEEEGDDDDDDDDDGGAASSSQIDFGPTFVSASNFNLDEYLERIQAQRSAKRGGKTDKAEPPSNKRSRLADTTKSNKNDHKLVQLDDDDDSQDESIMENLLDQTDSEAEDEDLEIGDEDEEVEIDDEDDEIDGEQDFDEDNEEDEDDNEEEEEEEPLFIRKIPHKIQVFLFSATLTLQDEGRESHVKHSKVSARDLSKRQNKIKRSEFEELTAAAEISQSRAQYEKGKAILIEISKRLTLSAPCVIDLSSQMCLPPTLQQYSIEIQDNKDRDQFLYGLLYERRFITCIVFVNSIHLVRKIADVLKELNINTFALHSDTDQKGRMMTLDKFRKSCQETNAQKAKMGVSGVNLDMSYNNTLATNLAGGFTFRGGSQEQKQNAQQQTNKKGGNKKGSKGGASPMAQRYGSVLICTDVLARGLDIPNIDLVVNYHVPFDAETYIHRCGRTARSGNLGRSVVLVTSEEDALWSRIQHSLYIGIGKNSSSVAVARAALDDLRQNSTTNKFSSVSTVLAQQSDAVASDMNVSDIRKINMNSRYLIGIRERLRHAKTIATHKVDKKTEKFAEKHDKQLADAMGFEIDDDWQLSKRELAARRSETEAIESYDRRKEERQLAEAKFQLRDLMSQKIITKGGSFDW